MPRPPKPNGSPWGYGDPFRISDDKIIEIADHILCIDSEDKSQRKKIKQLKTNIEYILGGYQALARTQRPSAASYRDEITDLRQKAYDLYNEIAGISTWTNNIFQQNLFDIWDTAHALGKFVDSASTALEKLEPELKTGRQKNPAVSMLVNTLYGQFQKYYNEFDQPDENDPYGTKKDAARQESLKRFLLTCLNLTEVSHPKDILSLIYDDRTPVEERLYIQISY